MCEVHWAHAFGAVRCAVTFAFLVQPAVGASTRSARRVDDSLTCRESSTRRPRDVQNEPVSKRTRCHLRLEGFRLESDRRRCRRFRLRRGLSAQTGRTYCRKITLASWKICAERSSMEYAKWYTTSRTPVWTILTAQRRQGHLYAEGKSRLE